MIGILIALQINNWNTQKNQSKTELGILEAMKENLNSDFIEIENNLKQYKTAQKSSAEVLNALNNPLYQSDSLNYYFRNLYQSAYFTETTSAYKNLQSNGYEIIKNERYIFVKIEKVIRPMLHKKKRKINEPLGIFFEKTVYIEHKTLEFKNIES